MKYILLFALAFPLFALAQDDDEWYYPSYEAIESAISDPESAFYYPPLFERMRQNDTTLNEEDYIYLYYGYAFQDAYMPYFSYEDPKLKKLLNKSRLSRKKLEEVVRRAQAGLEEAPFDLDLLLYTFNTLNQLGRQQESDVWYDRYVKILRTIYNSGDGVTTQAAYRVISVRHEYIMLQILGLQFAGSQSLTGDLCDYLKVETPNDVEVEGLFFDVSLLFRKMRKMFGEGD